MSVIFFLLCFIYASCYTEPYASLQLISKFQLNVGGGSVFGHSLSDNRNFIVTIFRGVEYSTIGNQTRFAKSIKLYGINVQNTGWFRQPCPNFENGLTDERCLFLDIYVPLTEKQLRSRSNNRFKLPVLIVFSTTKLNYIATSHFAKNNAIIVIEVQYRNGLLGFFKGDFGLEDQEQAINWISSRIRKFGGDETRISLFGSGINAACISNLLEYKLSKLMKSNVKSAILIDGSLFNNFKVIDLDKLERKLENAFGCYTYDLLTCLRKVPIHSLLFYGKDFYWYPTPSKRKYKIDSEMTVPLILGIDHAENTLKNMNFKLPTVYSPYEFKRIVNDILLKSIYAEDLSDNTVLLTCLEYQNCRSTIDNLINDLFISAPIIRYANAISVNSIGIQNVALYLFENKANFSVEKFLFGPLINDTDFIIGRNFFSKAFQLFIKERSPNGLNNKPITKEGIFWYPYTFEERQYLQYSSHLTKFSQKRSLRPRQMAFWNEYLMADNIFNVCANGGMDICPKAIEESSNLKENTIIVLSTFLSIIIIFNFTVFIVFCKNRKKEKVENTKDNNGRRVRILEETMCYFDEDNYLTSHTEFPTL